LENEKASIHAVSCSFKNRGRREQMTRKILNPRNIPMTGRSINIDAIIDEARPLKFSESSTSAQLF